MKLKDVIYESFSYLIWTLQIIPLNLLYIILFIPQSRLLLWIKAKNKIVYDGDTNAYQNIILNCLPKWILKYRQATHNVYCCIYVICYIIEKIAECFFNLFLDF